MNKASAPWTNNLIFAAAPGAGLLGDLGVIVVEAKPGEHEHGKESQLNERVPLRPQHCRQIHHGDNQYPAHRRRAFFAQHPCDETPALLSLVVVILTELQALQPVDDARPQDPAQ